MKRAIFLFFFTVLNVIISLQSGKCGAEPIKIYFFYSAGCHECIDIKDNFLPDITSRYSSKIDLQSFEINDANNFKILLQMEKQYALEPKNPPPTIFAGAALLDGEKEIREKLVPVIESLLKSQPSETGELSVKEPPKKIQTVKQKTIREAAIPEVKTSSSTNVIQEKFNYLGIPAIVFAGLIDGLNLCAFGILLLLVFFLTLTGYKKSQLLISGIAFTAAIFIVYFLIGIGLLEFVRQIKVFPLFRKILNLSTGIAAVILAGLSAHDSYTIHKGKAGDITLKLPKNIMAKIKSLIWASSGKTHYVLNAFILGAFIGILEFPCTGQIYFPIVIAIREIPGLRLHAVLLLLLYNLMFIVPLMLVFTSVYLGTNSDRYAEFLEQRAGVVKILTSIMFFILGLTLIYLAVK